MYLSRLAELIKSVSVYHTISDLTRSNRDWDCEEGTYTVGLVEDEYLFVTIYRAWNQGEFPTIYSGVVSKKYSNEGLSRGKNILAIDDRVASDIKIDLFAEASKYYKVDEHIEAIKNKSKVSEFYRHAFLDNFIIEIREIEHSSEAYCCLENHESRLLNFKLLQRLNKESLIGGDTIEKFDLILSERRPAKMLDLTKELAWDNVLGLHTYAYSRFEYHLNLKFKEYSTTEP